MTMASGNFSSNTGTNLNLYITWSSTTNVSANTSSVTVNVYSRSYTINGSALADSYVTVNGNTKSLAGVSLSQSVSNLTNKLLATYTVTVPHNSDGTKSITIKANIEFNGTVSGKYLSDITASQTVTLDTIPRSSSLSVPTSVNTGSNLTSTISPSSSSFAHKIAFIIDGSFKYTSDFINPGTNTFSYPIPHSWLPSATSKQMTVRLYTYTSTSADNYIARVDKTLTVNVPSSIKPTVSSLTTTIVDGLSGYYVEGKSKVKLTATATAGSGSSIASYVFTGANISGNSTTYTSTSATVTSGVIQTDGSVTYSVVAKDARPGRESSSKTASITVYPYAVPQITSITSQRCRSDGTLDDNGTYARVIIKTSHSPVNAANYITVKLSNSVDSTETNVVLKSYASTSENTYTVKAYGGNFQINNSYTITAVVMDYYNTGTNLSKSTTLQVAERTLNIAKYGNGLAIGGLSSVTSSTAVGKFECNWDAYFTKDIKIGGSTQQYFEVTRTGLSDDVNQDGVDETVDVRGQLYVNENGNVTCRRRFSTDNGTTYTTQGYWMLQDDRMFVDTALTASDTITSSRGRFNSSVDADAYTQNDIALRVGNPAGSHLDIDGNEIIAKNTASKLAELYLQGNAIGLYTNDTLAMTIGTDATNAYVQSAPAYARTYTGAANMYITSSGTFGRSTASSERYKKDIENVTNEELNPYKILDIPVRQFRYNEENVPVDGKPDDLYIGLIAEEVNKVYPAATEYTEDGQVEMWNIKVLFPALLKIVQDQQKEIEALKEQITNKVVSE